MKCDNYDIEEWCKEEEYNKKHGVKLISLEKPEEDSYYIGEDGLKYCPICNDPLEVILHPRNKPEIKLPSICLCTEKRIEEGRRRKHLLLKNAIFGEESDVEILELSGVRTD